MLHVHSQGRTLSASASGKPASSMKMIEGLAQSSTAMVLQQRGKHVTLLCLGHVNMEHDDTRPAALTVSCAAPLTAH